MPFVRDEGSGPAVLCLHSNAGTSSQWRALAALLADRHRVIAVDGYGAGKSPEWPDDRGLRLADEVELAASPIALAGERFAPVGHSYGAAVSVKHRADAPSPRAVDDLYEPGGNAGGRSVNVQLPERARVRLSRPSIERSTVSSTQRIRDAFDRMQRVFAKRPAVAQATATMRARIIDGLHCEAREGDCVLSLDLPVDAGGTDAGGTPGVHGRAALASCLAMSYGIELAGACNEARSVEGEVKVDYDNRGLLGMDDIKPGYLKVRHTLSLDTDAPREVVQPALESAAQQPLSGRLQQRTTGVGSTGVRATP